MEGAWATECRGLFAYLSVEDRELFLAGLRRERCKLESEMVRLLKLVFEGRKQVAARDLYYYMDYRGFSEPHVRKALKELGYTSKTLTRDFHEPRFFLNADDKSRGRLRLIPDEELSAPSKADRRLEAKFRSAAPVDRKNWDYYKN